MSEFIAVRSENNRKIYYKKSLINNFIIVGDDLSGIEIRINNFIRDGELATLGLSIFKEFSSEQEAEEFLRDEGLL